MSDVFGNETAELEFRLQAAPDFMEEMDKQDAKWLERAKADYAANGEPLEVLKQFGTWAMTADGVERLDEYYVITKDLLRDESWPLHIATKKRADMYDFLRAFYSARHHFYPDEFPSLSAIQSNSSGHRNRSK